jgi:aryl-alcohol dehydrogenase-like predicted oxidoreductase
VTLCEQYPLAVVQLPGNALDQRLASRDAIRGLAKVEVHLRSVFLQGLLLLPLELAIERVPKAAAALRNWAKWCSDQEISPLRAALSVVKTIPGVRYCVVGVDHPGQLEEIVAAWHDTRPLDMTSLSCEDLNTIDPRRWH